MQTNGKLVITEDPLADLRSSGERIISDLVDFKKQMQNKPLNTRGIYTDNLPISQAIRRATVTNGRPQPVTPDAFEVGPIYPVSTQARKLDINTISSYNLRYSINLQNKVSPGYLTVNQPNGSFSAPVYLLIGQLNFGANVDFDPYISINIGTLSYDFGSYIAGVTVGNFAFSAPNGIQGNIDLMDTLVSRLDFINNGNKITSAQLNKLLAGEVSQLAAGVYVAENTLSTQNRLFIDDLTFGLQDVGGYQVYSGPKLIWNYNIILEQIGVLSSY